MRLFLTSPNFFFLDITKFLWICLVSDPTFKLRSYFVPELCKVLYIKDLNWPADIYLFQVNNENNDTFYDVE